MVAPGRLARQELLGRRGPPVLRGLLVLKGLLVPKEPLVKLVRPAPPGRLAQ